MGGSRSPILLRNMWPGWAGLAWQDYREGPHLLAGSHGKHMGGK